MHEATDRYGLWNASEVDSGTHTGEAAMTGAKLATPRRCPWFASALPVLLLLAGLPVGAQQVPADRATPRTDANSRLAHEQLLAKRTQGRIDVYFIGNSITRRWGATDYPEFLANWKQNFFGWNAADFGWGADRTEHMLWRLENGELDGVNPRIIVIAAGTNNVGGRPGDDAKVADITRGIRALVDLAHGKAPKATIVLMGIFPRNGQFDVVPEINRINASISRFANGTWLRYLNINDKLADQNGKLFEGMTVDNLHLSLRGYQVWADALKPIFTEILGPPAATDQAPPPTGDPSARAVTVRADAVPFGILPDSQPVHAWTIANRAGMSVRVMDYGATIIALRVPDRNGAVEDVVLGFDSLSGYARARRYMGAVVGRYGNRIRNGQFTIDGRSYQLARNNGPNHLHGGPRGFDRVIWQVRPVQRGDSAGIVLTYTSPAGEESYPGTLQASVTYLLTPDNRLVIDYGATTDAPTPVNLTQHTFFNLAGARRDVLDHVLTINASAYTPVDSTSIPTGEVASVTGTPFDFREPTSIGARIRSEFPQLRRFNGYDHNFVLDRTAGGGLSHAVHVLEPESGRTLDVYTDQPGLQLFTGNSLNGSAIGKGGRPYARYYGFCLETQHFPDSPNHPEFPSTLLRPGEQYRTRTVWAFGVSK